MCGLSALFNSNGEIEESEDVGGLPQGVKRMMSLKWLEGSEVYVAVGRRTVAMTEKRESLVSVSESIGEGGGANSLWRQSGAA